MKNLINLDGNQESNKGAIKSMGTVLRSNYLWK